MFCRAEEKNNINSFCFVFLACECTKVHFKLFTFFRNQQTPTWTIITVHKLYMWAAPNYRPHSPILDPFAYERLGRLARHRTMSNSAGDSELLNRPPHTLRVEKWGAKRRCLTLALSDGFLSVVPNNLRQKAASSKGLMYNVYSATKRGRKPCLSGCQRKSPGSTNFLSALLVVWLICPNFGMFFYSETSMVW